MKHLFNILILGFLLTVSSCGLQVPSMFACNNGVWSEAKVVFDSTSALNGSWDGATTNSNNIWIMDADGSNRTALTRNTLASRASFAAQFSPDGSKIVFYSQTALDGSWDGTATLANNIWIMDADGSNRVALTRNTLAGRNSVHPIFSPDGTKIAFYSQTAIDGSWDGTGAVAYNIWIMNTDGTGRTPLTLNTVAGSGYSFMPKFSPDGSKILFYSQTALDGSWNGTAIPGNIWIMNVDGTSRVALTQNTAGSRLSSDPIFSSDGTKILFSSQTALDGSWDGTAAPYNIWIMNVDGTNRVALTQNTAGARNSNFPTYSPDGSKILFRSMTALDGSWDGAATLSENVWTMNIDGTGRTALTQNTLASRGVTSLRYFTDGEKIAFTSTTALNGSWDGVATTSRNVWVMDSDGTNREALTQNTAASLHSGININRSVYQSLTCNP